MSVEATSYPWFYSQTCYYNCSCMKIVAIEAPSCWKNCFLYLLVLRTFGQKKSNKHINLIVLVCDFFKIIWPVYSIGLNCTPILNFDHAMLFVHRDNDSILSIIDYFDCLEVRLNKNMFNYSILYNSKCTWIDKGNSDQISAFFLNLIRPVYAIDKTYTFWDVGNFEKYDTQIVMKHRRLMLLSW